MKNIKSLIIATVCGAPVVLATPMYQELSTPWCDEENKVIYDGKGYFAVESPADTELELRINMDSLHSYINSNDYKSGNALIEWDADHADYGLADNADTARSTGAREPYLTGYWQGRVWKPLERASYAKLRSYAAGDGCVVLRVRSSKREGVTAMVKDKAGVEHVVYRAPALKAARNTTVCGYRVNTNYVAGVTLHTASTLNTASYTPPKDYTQAFVSTCGAGGASLRRLMFMGDSITHGVNDQTWRWQLFKTLVDNGIEAEIVGPRSGYTPGYTKLSTPDAGESYGGIVFPNVHLAQSSGRTHNIISGSNAGMTGVNYGGHSTRSAADTYNCDTWCSLMGTNDLLSDPGYTETAFAAKMQRMLGGQVVCEDGTYRWIPGEDWGNIGRMVADVVRDASDVYYVMAVPCWGRHHNNNQPERHTAVQQYNELLRQWVISYSASKGQRVVFVDVNEGLVDPAHEVPFSWPDSMSNRPGRDGLHPNAQGSLIMAGNVARAMGLAGRTAGLPRAAADSSWQSAACGEMGAGQAVACAAGELATQGGYSVECCIRMGNGAKDGWLGAEKSLNITVGNGTQGGVVRVSEGTIMWGDMVLYGGDQSAQNKLLRIVWHPGHVAHNVQRGFYVWLGDMLIGQGLQAHPGMERNGIHVQSQAGTGRVEQLRWVNHACAPASSGKMNPERAYTVGVWEE